MHTAEIREHGGAGTGGRLLVRCFHRRVSAPSSLDRQRSDLAVDKTRLIECAFPLKQASLDSVHEKNVRHGHISTLHIWPARRPLAASRAALIATLLKDPQDAEVRRQLLSKLGGKLIKDGTDTEGGILHWGRETSPDLQWF